MYKKAYHFRDVSINWRIIKWMLKKQDVWLWTGFSWLWVQSSSGLFLTCHTGSGSRKDDKLLDQLSSYKSV